MSRKGMVMDGLMVDNKAPSGYVQVRGISQLPPRPGFDDGSITIDIKLCLVCMKEHTHNNAYCSAECCKKDK